jgi:hypothetical protein
MMNLQSKQAHVFLTWQLKLLAVQVLTDKARLGSKLLVAPSLALSVQQYANMVLDAWQTGSPIMVTLDKQVEYEKPSFTLICI